MSCEAIFRQVATYLEFATDRIEAALIAASQYIDTIFKRCIDQSIEARATYKPNTHTSDNCVECKANVLTVELSQAIKTVNKQQRTGKLSDEFQSNLKLILTHMNKQLATQKKQDDEQSRVRSEFTLYNRPEQQLAALKFDTNDKTIKHEFLESVAGQLDIPFHQYSNICVHLLTPGIQERINFLAAIEPYLPTEVQIPNAPFDAS